MTATDQRFEGLEAMIMKLGEVRGLDADALRSIHNMNNAIEHHHRQQQGTA